MKLQIINLAAKLCVTNKKQVCCVVLLVVLIRFSTVNFFADSTFIPIRTKPCQIRSEL